MVKKTLIFTGKCLIASSIGAFLGAIALKVALEVTLSEQNQKFCKYKIQSEFLPLENSVRILDWRNKK